MILFRVRYRAEPGLPHVHVRLFAADDGGSFVLLGTVTMTHSEFIAFRAKFKADFIEDTLL